MHRRLEVIHGAFLGGDNLFPVPLVHIDRVDIIQFLIPTDGVHIGIQSLAGLKAVAEKRQALPLGQRMDDLRLPPDIRHIKGDGALHAVQIVIEARGSFHKQRGRDTAEVQIAAQRILKQPLDQTDGFLGIVQRKTAVVPLRNEYLAHSFGLL